MPSSVVFPQLVNYLPVLLYLFVVFLFYLFIYFLDLDDKALDAIFYNCPFTA